MPDAITWHPAHQCAELINDPGVNAVYQPHPYHRHESRETDLQKTHDGSVKTAHIQTARQKERMYSSPKDIAAIGLSVNIALHTQKRRNEPNFKDSENIQHLIIKAVEKLLQKQTDTRDRKSAGS